MECGADISLETEFCHNCGHPILNTVNEGENTQKVELTKISIPLFKKKSFLITIISVILVIAIGVCVIFFLNKHQTNKYYTKMESISYTMFLGASKAESAGNLVHDVWYNSIYDNFNKDTFKYTMGASDFNVALTSLFENDEFKQQIDSIKENQEIVNNDMKKLKNPPKQYKEAYEDLENYYEIYTKFVNLVINPTGSLSSFTNNFNEVDSQILNCYNKMKLNFKD